MFYLMEREPLEQSNINKKRVLIIEDETPLLDSYAEAMENLGLEVVKADSGIKGLDELKHSKRDFDLILLDLMMPVMDGLEVLRTINSDKEAYSSSPVVVLTNMTSERVIREAFDLGAASYLIKSELSYEDLLKEISKMLGLE